MPLFSEHIANMYYGSSSPYTGLPYSYSSSVSPLGSSYSASYLNPGSSYSGHSSLSSYSRAPLSSRWITSAGRNYSPMLTTISERGSGSPMRINSPRRIPISSRTYGTPTYTPRPVNINTADIDVSRDRYRHKVEPPPKPVKPEPTKPTESPNVEDESGPFMPRVDGKPETGIDSSPGVERGTIKRGRTVVRLYTIKRNSPRKPNEEIETSDATQDKEEEHQNVNEEIKNDGIENMKWREKLSDDLTYKNKKEKKTLGAKLVEKFHVKDLNASDTEIPTKVKKKVTESSQSLPATPVACLNVTESKLSDRRCSMELLAEQANLLDSLIRSENLSTATLDLSKVGIATDRKNSVEKVGSIKRRSPDNLPNSLKTTKSDHSLHDSLNSYKDVRDPRNYSKRRSIKKSSSSSCIRRLDSITEFPKEPLNVELPAIEESRFLGKQDTPQPLPKPKLKAKITASVEVSPPMSPLKFRVENITVEEKPRVPRKEITYSSELETPSLSTPLPQKITDESKEINNVKKRITKKNVGNEPDSPEPDDGNFWNKIGKRETVYLLKRKQNLDEVKEKHKRALFWFPEEEEKDNIEKVESINLNNSKPNFAESTDVFIDIIDQNIPTEINAQTETVLQNQNGDISTIKSDKSILVPKKECIEPQKVKYTEIKEHNTDIKNESNMNIESNCSDVAFPEIISILHEPTTNTDNLKITKKVKEDVKEAKSCPECKKIGKSASLDNVDENKAKKQSQKKTKSEKSKKALKLGKAPESKSPMFPLPKHNAQKEVLKKCEASKKPEGITENNVLEQNVRPINDVLNNVIKKQVADFVKDESDTQVPSPPNKHEEPKPTTILEINKIENKSVEVGLESNKSNQSVLEENTNSMIPHNALKIVEPEVQKEIIKEKAESDGSKSTEIPQTSSPKIERTDDKVLGENKTNNVTNTITHNNAVEKLVDTKVLNKNIKTPQKSSPELKPKPSAHVKKSSGLSKTEKTDDKALKATIMPLSDGEPSTTGITANTSSVSANILTDGSSVASQHTDDINCNSPVNLITHPPDVAKRIESQNIPKKETESKPELTVQTEPTKGENNKAENIIQKDEQPETSNQIKSPEIKIPKKPVKVEKAVRPLIATPRPLQRKAPQVIHSSDSSDTSSEEESSDEEDEDESEASEDSAEFYECDNNTDGRTSTGSNDSGFDSSAPTSPATFSQIKKDCDVNCHRKCEKLTANLCGVNQRLLVEALASRTASRKGGEASGASSSAAPSHSNNTDISEQELEQSTAYDIFKKTGRFTPPARSIPRFRKYTVEDFQFIKVLGKGSFGKVLLAELRDTEYYYAVKCLKKDVVLEDDDVECTLIERKVLALGTNHPYLCHLFATFQTDSHLFFVMEYLNGGDLMFHIQQSGRFPEARARFYAAEIVSGLKFLHKRGIVYRDLKLDNILLDFEGHVRIADFGMCKLQIYLDKTADTFCGTPDYMAPEIIKGLKYNQTVDWWSFGVLLYEMLIGQSPFSGCDEDELFWSICNEMPSYPRFLSQEALTILTRLLDKDARTRLGGTECMHGDIRDQDFFHPIHWDRLERRELEAPFRPRVRHPMDTQYFDRAFTGERPRLTAVEPHVLRSMDQEPFRGFSYTNPNTTDR